MSSLGGDLRYWQPQNISEKNPVTKEKQSCSTGRQPLLGENWANANIHLSFSVCLCLNTVAKQPCGWQTVFSVVYTCEHVLQDET